MWSLPVAEVPHPEGKDLYRAFARSLLDGSIMPAMLDLRPHLVAPPTQMMKQPATHARVVSLHFALESRKVSSKSTLLALWKINPNFLLEEVQQWVQRPHQRLLAKMWPPTSK